MNKNTRQFPLADAALAGALLTVLAFQELRFEGYETEKAALLLIFGAVIVGCWLPHFPRMLKAAVSSWHTIPLSTAGVLLLLLLAIVTTPFALSPSRSIFGAPDRAQGLLTTLVYGILFFHAALNARRILPLLPPILTLCGVVMGVYSLLIYTGLDVERPGSTTGNPNYVASWAVMALPIITAHLLIQWRGWKRPFSPANWLYLGVLASAVIALLIALGLSASRGALLGLGVAVMLAGAIWAASQGNRRFLWGIAAFALLATGAYVGISTQVDDQSTTGLARIFRPYDAFRVEAWTAAATVMHQQGDALFSAAGDADSWLGLRRFVGYGLDSVGQTQSRFGEIESYGQGTIFLNSFHNLIFDALVMQGVIGLLAWILIFLGAGMLGFRALAMLSQRDLPFLLLTLTAGSIFGAILLNLIVPGGELSALLPAGAGLGAALGVLAWPIIFVMRTAKSADGSQQLNNHAIWIIALLGVAITHWIELQFGFATSASDPLWWVLLGLLVGITHLEAEQPTIETTPSAWAVTTLCAGLLLLLSLGTSVKSELLTHTLGEQHLSTLLLTVVLIGGAGILSSGVFKHIPWRLIAAIPLIWGSFFALKSVLNGIGGDALGSALLGEIPRQIGTSYFLMSFKGVLAAGVMLVAWTLRDGLPRIPAPALSFVVLAFALGSIFYVTNYAGATLHSIGNSLSATDQPRFMGMADATYATAVDAVPYNSRLDLDYAYNIVKLIKLNPAIGEAPLDARLDHLFAVDPFIINTWEWTVYEQQSALVRAATP